MVVAERRAQIGARDFDFLWGHWQIEHLRLTSRLTDSTDWERFEATMQCWPILGGTGNVDNMRANWRGQAFEGASLRLCDPATGLWSIYWADSVGHQLLPPVVGTFADGVGEFYGDDQHEGQPVRVRFRWSEIATDTARWEQAFSTDRGASWETNWIMRFTRLAGHAAQEAREMTATTTLALDAFGNVPSAYRHETRVATPLEPLALPGTVCKWYHVHRIGEPVAEALDSEARAVLAEAAASGAWDLSYGLNFALLHQSTAGAFLIAGVWRGHQELWERIYAYDLTQGGPFVLAEPDGGAHPTACVWELGVICHERQAWQRYLFSARDEAAKRAWLTDTYAGEV